MTKKLFPKMLVMALAIGVFGVLHAHAQSTENLGTSTEISNVSPAISATPSDGGSNNGTGLADTKGNPTNVGSNVTFTATAHDTNSDQYYLAICKTDAVTAGSGAAPTCGGGAWAVSTATASDAQASVTYTTVQDDVESNDWYAFVCDNVTGGGACFPANAAGDQGYALGTATFSVRPTNGDTITLNGDVYEFNTGACSGSQDVCVTVTTTGDSAQAAANLAAADATAGLHMTARGSVTYIYADAKGVAGNSITLAKSSAAITLSAATLAGGDDDNAMPFYVNHKPVINSYAYGDTAATGHTAATGLVQPGDALHISVNVTDTDTNAAQDTVSLYVCESAGFTAGATPACTGTEFCHVTGVNPDTTDPTCSGTVLTTVPTAHDTYHVYTYVVDNHGTQATEEADHTFVVQEVAPVLNSYVSSDFPAPAAGGSDTIDWTLTLHDDNGDNDVTNVLSVFFDKSTVTNGCTADENNCYIMSTCTLSDVSTAGTGKTAKGTDANLTATCHVTVYFNANASTDWEVQAKVTDDSVVTEFADSGSALANAAMQGIDIVQPSIAYGTVAIGGTAAAQETSIGNVGNQVLDVYVGGANMCTDYPTCAGSQIAVGQQKFHSGDGAGSLVNFDWDATADTHGPFALTSGTGSGTGEATGCLNRDIAVRNDHTSTTETNESINWKIRIPASQAAGSYTGANVFTSAASETCTTATLH